MQKDIQQSENYKHKGCGDVASRDQNSMSISPPRNITSPELFTAELMRQFGPGIAMVGYTETASLSDTSSIVCGSGFILEGRFLITAAVVHDTLSWHEPGELFAAVIDSSESSSEKEGDTLRSGGRRQNDRALRHIPITFIDCDYERGIAVYRLATQMPVRISFADIDFSENELLTGLNAITLSYCAANESFRCNRTPILMSGEAYVRAGCGGVADCEEGSGSENVSVQSQSQSETAMPLIHNDRLYSIINAALDDQEYGAPLLRASKSDTSPPKIISIVGGSLEYMYRDFIIIEDNPQLCIAWPFARFTNSSLFNRMNEEIKSNASLINDAATAPYQTGHANQVAASTSASNPLDDNDAFEDDINEFMDEFDSEDEDNILGRGLDDAF